MRAQLESAMCDWGVVYSVSSKQSGTTVINITPPNKMEHRLLEHLHSTPLPSIINAEIAKDGGPTATDLA